MYLPAHFDASAQADHWLPRLLARDPFVTLVSVHDGAPFASHLPVLAERDADGRWILLGHWARANPQWQGIEAQPVLAIVHGPHAYVSPRGYPDPARSVPTWNYAAAHLSGRVERVDDAAAVLQIVDRLSAHFEATAPAPWSRAGADASLAQLARAIVGFRLRVERVEVKLKLGQNHPPAKAGAAAAALAAAPDAASREVAAWMHEVLAARDG